MASEYSSLNSVTVQLVKQPGLPVYAQSNKIYPKRMAGAFRNLKWWTASLWLSFFLGPYLRWQDQQAILFDIPARKFHFFDLVIYPQDVWLLTFIMLFFAMLLILATIIAGRIFCGYFCFQTVWTDFYMWIEERFEGSPNERKQLDQSPWNIRKLSLKAGKHSTWLLIAALTGVSFAAWFTDAYQLWIDLFNLQADESAWIVLALFSTGTYLFAGIMQEQVCFWLCPYARIQGAIYEENTILPTYDHPRGEPRAQRRAQHSEQRRVALETANQGDCIDCDLCVAVCPTGIDIRDGQQIGCITCGLCIDACDHVMEKLERPKGLIRYTSLTNLVSGKDKPLYKIPLVLISLGILILSVVGTIYGIKNISELSVSVLHHRQPEFIKLSSGEIRNRYQLKIQNKTNSNATYQLSIIGLSGSEQISKKTFIVPAGEAVNRMISLDVAKTDLQTRLNPISFHLEDQGRVAVDFQTVFIAPIE